MLVEIMNYSGQSIRALEQVVRALGPLPGRKMVVLLSDGFLVGLGASDTRHFDLRRVVDAATRSGVVVYALDTRGLVAEAPGGNAAFGGPPVFAAPGARESLQGRSIEALRDGMVALSEDTGGFLARNSNDLSAGLGKILRDSQLYYLLAYEPVEHEAGRQVPPHRGEAAEPTGPAGAHAQRLLRRGRARPGGGHARRPRRPVARAKSPRASTRCCPSRESPCAWWRTSSTFLPMGPGRW